MLLAKLIKVWVVLGKNTRDFLKQEKKKRGTCKLLRKCY